MPLANVARACFTVKEQFLIYLIPGGLIVLNKRRSLAFSLLNNPILYKLQLVILNSPLVE